MVKNKKSVTEVKKKYQSSLLTPNNIAIPHMVSDEFKALDKMISVLSEDTVRNDMTIGVNNTTREIENNNICATIVINAEGVLGLTQHVSIMCELRNIPHISVKERLSLPGLERSRVAAVGIRRPIGTLMGLYNYVKGAYKSIDLPFFYRGSKINFSEPDIIVTDVTKKGSIDNIPRKSRRAQRKQRRKNEKIYKK